MSRKSDVNKTKKQITTEAFVLPKRLNNYFTFLFISYVIVACGAGLYILWTSLLVNVELSKFVQYPTSVPILVAVFVSFFMLYVCIMIKQHLKAEGKIYREDTFILRGMLLTQVLTLNYLTLIPTVLLYLSLRKQALFTKERYPHLDDESVVLPVVSEKIFYIMTFTIIILAVVFALLTALSIIVPK